MHECYMQNLHVKNAFSWTKQLVVSYSGFLSGTIFLFSRPIARLYFGAILIQLKSIYQLELSVLPFNCHDQYFIDIFLFI